MTARHARGRAAVPPAPARKQRRTPRRDADPVRVYPNGRVWYWDGGRAGAGQRRAKRFPSVEAAEAWAEEFRAAAQAPVSAAGPRTHLPLDQLMRDYVAHLEKAGAPQGTIRQYRSNWNTWVPEDVGAVPCGEAAFWHYTTIFTGLTEARALLGTVRPVARTLSATLGWGVLNGYFGLAEPFGSATHRAAAVKDAKDRARKRAGEVRHYDNASCPTPEDVDLFADAVEQQYPGYGRRLVLLGFATGLRFAELLALDWTLVDALTGEILVEWQLDRYRPWPARSLPKNDKRRSARIWKAYLPVLQSLVADALARPGEDHGWLFPRHRSTTAWADRAGKLVGAAVDACDWDWTFHWLRHGYASWSLHPKEHGGYGMPIKVVSECLGHSRYSTTEDMYVERHKDDADAIWHQTGHRPGGR
jgi:integrase